MCASCSTSKITRFSFLVFSLLALLLQWNLCDSSATPNTPPSSSPLRHGDGDVGGGVLCRSKSFKRFHCWENKPPSKIYANQSLSIIRDRVGDALQRSVLVSRSCCSNKHSHGCARWSGSFHHCYSVQTPNHHHHTGNAQSLPSSLTTRCLS
jgi:hypothetical protein